MLIVKMLLLLQCWWLCMIHFLRIHGLDVRLWLLLPEHRKSWIQRSHRSSGSNLEVVTVDIVTSAVIILVVVAIIIVIECRTAENSHCIVVAGIDSHWKRKGGI